MNWWIVSDSLNILAFYTKGKPVSWLQPLAAIRSCKRLADRFPYCLLTACLCVALVDLAGCASSLERHAFEEWIRLDKQRYDGRNETSADTSPNELRRQQTDSLNEDATLESFLRLAAYNNPGLEAAFNDWKAALERIPQVRALPDPRFNYKYFIVSVETRVGPQRQAFGLTQAFPWFGKLDARAGVAIEAARAAQAHYEVRKQKLFFDVKQAYFEYYYLSRSLAVVRENRDLVKYLEGVAQTRFKTAAGSHPDVIRAQVELGKLDDRVRTLEALRVPLAAKLNALMNRPLNIAIAWPRDIPEPKQTLDAGKLETVLAQSNPELRALQHNIARERAGIHLSKKDYYPDVTIGVDYIDTSGRNGVSLPDNGQDAVAAGFSINIPLNKEKYDAGVRESLARFGSATKMRVDRQNVLASELMMAIYHYEDAKRKVNLFRDTLVPKAKQSLKATEASFRLGKSGFIDLVDAERVFLEFQLATERAFADGAIRLAEIEKLIGTHIENVKIDDTLNQKDQETNPNDK